MKLSSGYILSAFDTYLKQNRLEKSYLEKLSSFEVETTVFQQEPIEIDQELAPFATLHNLIIRGFPTYSSIYLELSLSKWVEHLNHDFSKAELKTKLSKVPPNNLFQNLHVSPGPTSQLRSNQHRFSDSKFEKSLIQLLENEFGAWISNILCQQVPFSEISDSMEFEDQKVDFLLPFPTRLHDLNGFIIEMDGPQHRNYNESDLDKRRDNEALQNGFATIRIPASDSTQQRRTKLRQLKKYLQPKYFSPFFSTDKSDTTLSDKLLLLPIACSRIQLCLLKAILHNKDWLSDQTIKIAIIERDLHWLKLAVDDLNYWLAHLSVLTERKNFPGIECEIFKDPSEIDDFDLYHAIFDHSIKHRIVDLDSKAFPNAITIRNAPLYAKPQRKVLSGPHLQYEPFGKFEHSKWEVTDPDKVKSLEYFLRSLFRKRGFKPGQLPILNRALCGESVIGLLPTGGGKSLTYQLSALMQPGVCMVVDPIISLMRDQVKGLKVNWIDACVFINSSISREKKVKHQKMVRNGEALFFFISPERLLMSEFRGYLKDMPNQDQPIFFNYCVIDEAHCVSEWGHDFRTSYLSVAENGIRFCTTHDQFEKSIPLFALTATASYDVLTDIQRELSGNSLEFKLGEESIVAHNTKRKELYFKIEQIEADDLRNLSGFELKKKIAELKNDHLAHLIEKHKNDLKKNSGLVFTPHRSHYFGITDRFSNRDEPVGVLDNLGQNFPELRNRMGFFMGSGDGENNNSQKHSLENQDKFIDGELNLLVATKAFGMGIDKNNVRFTVHYNYPSSIESFLQEAGRAGRDEKDSSCYLLFTNPELVNEDVEYDVNKYFHSRAYRGAEKEKQIIGELLFKIFEPDRTYSLTADIQNEFDIEAVVTIWKWGENRYISVQESFEEKVGRIMINGGFRIYLDDDVQNGESPYSADEANRILTYLKNKITTQGNASQVWEWLNSSGGTRKGIIDVIKNKCSGEKYSGSLDLAWENNIRERIKLIQSFVKDALSRSGQRFQNNYVENLVEGAVRGKSNALDFDDFIDQINHGLRRNNFDLIEHTYARDERVNQKKGYTLKKLKTHYFKVRDKADTEKAIYRLRLLGVIDDYTVDYRTQMFTLYLSKKREQEYNKRLIFYLSKFYSDERVKEEIKKANTTAGKNTIHKYLNYLVDFGYEQIAEKRARSIIDMKEACNYGVENKSEDLALFLDLYLNSKYSRDEYLVDDVNESLPHRLENGKISDEQYIWRYIELMKKDGNSEINNLKHLRGATLRMLRVSTDNPVLRALAAYATFILEYSTPRLLTEAENNLMAALDYYVEKENWNEKRLKTFFQKLVDIIRLKRPEIDQYYQFEYENFRLSAINKSLGNINRSLDHLNKIVLPHG